MSLVSMYGAKGIVSKTDAMGHNLVCNELVISLLRPGTSRRAVLWDAASTGQLPSVIVDSSKGKGLSSPQHLESRAGSAMKRSSKSIVVRRYLIKKRWHFRAVLYGRRTPMVVENIRLSRTGPTKAERARGAIRQEQSVEI